MSAANITKTVSFDVTKILFCGTLHLAFKHNDVVGFQSWRDYNSKFTLAKDERGPQAETKVEHEKP